MKKFSILFSIILSVNAFCDESKIPQKMRDLWENPITDARIENGRIAGSPFIQMNGRQVFKLAVSSLSESFVEVCGMAGIAPGEVDVWVPHQANIRIIEMIADKLGIPKDKTVETVQMHGNTSAASVPLALDWAVKNGRIHEGDTVMLQGVGAGMTWGSVLLKW